MEWASWYVHPGAKCLSNLWLCGLPHFPEEITWFTMMGHPPFLLSDKISTSQLLPLLTPGSWCLRPIMSLRSPARPWPQHVAVFLGETNRCRNVLPKCPVMYDTGMFPFLLEKPLSWCTSRYSLLQYCCGFFRAKEKSPKGLTEYGGCSLGTILKSFIGGSVCYGLGLTFSNILNASNQLVLLSENLVSSNWVFSPLHFKKKCFIL